MQFQYNALSNLAKLVNLNRKKIKEKSHQNRRVKIKIYYDEETQEFPVLSVGRNGLPALSKTSNFHPITSLLSWKEQLQLANLVK